MRTHVLFVCRSTPFHGLGGMEVVAWELACGFARHGLDVTFLTAPIPARPPRFEEAGVRVVTVPGARHTGYSRRWWRGTRAYVREDPSDFDAVFSVSAGAYGLLPLRRQLGRAAFLLQVHGTSADELISKWRSRDVRAWLTSAKNALWIPRDLRAYRQFDRIVAVGDAVYRSLTAGPVSPFVRPGQVTCIPNGIDTAVFSPDADRRAAMRRRFGFPAGATVVVTACRLHPQKGLRHALHGFAKFLENRPHAYFVIMGDGPEKDDLRALSRQLGVDGRVYFTGAVPRRALPDYLRMGDVFLFPTLRNEGLPLNVLEAVAVGLPVVVSERVQLSREGIAHYYPVRPTDIGDMAEKMAAAARHPVPANRLPDRYSLDGTVRRYLALIPT